jgi:hypothetical protein
VRGVTPVRGVTRRYAIPGRVVAARARSPLEELPYRQLWTVCVCVYVERHLRTCAQGCPQVYLDVHACVCVCIYIYSCACVCVYICIYIYIYICVCVCVCVCLSRERGIGLRLLVTLTRGRDHLVDSCALFRPLSGGHPACLCNTYALLHEMASESTLRSCTHTHMYVYHRHLCIYVSMCGCVCARGVWVCVYMYLYMHR